MSPAKGKIRTALKLDTSDAVQDKPHSRFVCVPCGHVEVEGHPACTIQGSDLCQECFDAGYRPQFEAYVEDESSPVLWAGKPVSIDTVQHQFSSSFVVQYRRRMQEYAVKPNERLYCSSAVPNNCGSYIGEKTEYIASRICLSCGEKTCARCGSQLGKNSQADHSCVEEEDQTVNPFHGLQRGKDWQACPGCSMPVNLRDACNHMTCALSSCKTHFCYTCGAEASPDDGSGHWDLTKACALWGPQRTIERRLQAIDEIELNRIKWKCLRIEDRLGDDGPLWLMDAAILAMSLLVFIQCYTIHEQQESNVQHILTLRERGEQMLKDQEVEMSPAVEAKFPSLVRITATYRLAKEERWDELRAELANRPGYA